MKIKNVSEEDLDDWRESHVAYAIRECLQKVHDAQKQACLEAYWSRNPWEDWRVEALKYQSVTIGEIFEATKEDMMAVMEQIDAEPIGMDAD
ncbi:MAG: hypothetical protein AAF438_16975 [Pseudomonadota bacterium]